MSEDSDRWNTDTSALYRQVAAVAVPARAEQIAAILTLLPFRQADSFRVVELASGEGRLAYAILSAFPHATLLALDLEESMRDETAARLRAFGARASVAPFDMAAADWYGLLEGADAVVSSLCIHHLDGPQKQGLFRAIRARLPARGALLIADLIQPQRAEARELSATTWDHAAEAASMAQTGSRAGFEAFQATQWNYFRYPDPFDKPSPLFDQLLWLREAGFTVADCFWLQAGHAIYGGYVSAGEGGGLPFEQALSAARVALQD